MRSDEKRWATLTAVVLDAALQLGSAAKFLAPEQKAKAVELITAAQAKSNDKGLMGRALDQLR